MSVTNPHDKFFKKMFSDKNNVVDLIRDALSEDLVSAIDLSSAEYLDTSFIDDDLKDVQSDLLVKTRVKNAVSYVYILFEHKSYFDKYSLYQMLKYMLKIWDADRINCSCEYLTPIIPIFFYHGDKKWTLGNSFSVYFKDNVLLNDFVPDFKSIIYDVSEIDAGGLNGNVWYQSSIMLMKYIKRIRPHLESILDFIADYIGDDKIHTELITICVYLLNTCDSSEKDFIVNMFKKDRLERNYMTIKESLIKEGLERGLERGREEGLERGLEKERLEIAKKMKMGDMSIEKIKQFTGLSEDEINDL